MKKLSIEEVKKKYHPKIWQKLKTIINSIDAFIDFKLFYIQDEKDRSKLINLKMQFIRSLIFAESEKYVSEKNPTIEGIAHDYYAVQYCFEKFLIDKYKKNKKILPLENIIKEEAESWNRLGIHPKIDKMVKNSYKKNSNVEIMNQLAILINDKNLEFSSPAYRFLNKYFILIFLLVMLIIAIIFK